MMLPRPTLLLASLAIGVLAVQGKSKETSPPPTTPDLSSFDAQMNELTADNVFVMQSADAKATTLDSLLSEMYLTPKMAPVAMKFDFQTNITDEDALMSCPLGADDAKKLAKNKELDVFLAVMVGPLKGYDKSKGLIFGICQAYTIPIATIKLPNFIGAEAGPTRSESMVDNLKKAGHNISIDKSPAALQALKDLKSTRAQDARDNAKAAAEYYAQQGHEPGSEAGQESKMSDPGVSKGDKKEKTDKKEKSSEKGGSKHDRRRL